MAGGATRSISSLATRYPPSLRGLEQAVGISSLAMRYQRGLSLVGFEEILHSVQNDRVRHHYATRRVTKYGAHSEIYNSIFIFFLLCATTAT